MVYVEPLVRPEYVEIVDTDLLESLPVLRGQALAPSSYRPVASAVRSPEEVEAMEAVSAIKGGIRVRRPVASSDTSASTPGTADAQDSREPALAGKP